MLEHDHPISILLDAEDGGLFSRRLNRPHRIGRFRCYLTVNNSVLLFEGKAINGDLLLLSSKHIHAASFFNQTPSLGRNLLGVAVVGHSLDVSQRGETRFDGRQPLRLLFRRF